MRRRALDLLVCPRCGGGLEVSDAARTDDDEIIEGSLRCAGGRHEFPVRGGVPRLAAVAESPPAEKTEAGRSTVARFGASWNHFDRRAGHYEEQFLGWVAPNEPTDFAGKVVLEGGCGKGRHSEIVAGWGARDVLAVDLSSAVDVAFENCRHLPNVHVVQADLLELPVPERSIDIAFSVGVLHHLESPQSGFASLARRVTPGGKVIAWVYGRENNGWIIHGVNPVRESVTSRLPFEAVVQLSRLPAGLLWLVSRGLYRPLSRGPLKPVGQRLFYRDYLNQLADFPFWELHCIVADHLVPPIAHYIPYEEFIAWFDAASLIDTTITWHNQNSWRGTGRVPG